MSGYKQREEKSSKVEDVGTSYQSSAWKLIASALGLSEKTEEPLYTWIFLSLIQQGHDFASASEQFVGEFWIVVVSKSRS